MQSVSRVVSTKRDIQTYYVYVLRLRNNKYYVGYSSDLRTRLKDHQRRKVQSTKNLTPELTFYAAFKNRRKAQGFEKYLKSSSGFAFRNKRLI